MLEEADKVLEAVAMGYPQKPVVYYGLRGVGKTVLLNAVEEKAEELDKGFFKIRYDRCTKKEHDFLFAMVRCGDLPCTVPQFDRYLKRINPDLTIESIGEGGEE